MRKQITLAVVIAISGLNASAQFVITKSNMPTSSAIAINITDSFPSVFEGTPGTGKTWDFSGLNETTRDTTEYISPVGTPAAAKYPGANLAGYLTSNGTYAYLDVNSNYFAALGQFSSATGINTSFNPVNKIFKFPMTYQDSFNDTAVGKSVYLLPTNSHNLIKQYFGKNYDSARTTTTRTSQNIIDATGTMTTHEKIFSNVMRIHRIINNKPSTEYRDSTTGVWETNAGLKPYVDINDSTSKYEWYSSSYCSAVASTSLFAKGSTTKYSASYLTQSNKATTGVAYITNKNAFAVYPNPASTEVYFSTSPEAHSINIYDVAGRLQTSIVTSAAGNSTKYNASQLNTGTYIYHVLNSEGKTITSGKINVTR